MNTSRYYAEVVPSDGKRTTPPPQVLARYDQAIREGDYGFMGHFLTLYGHWNVPSLNLPPIDMLANINHDALIMLDEKDYIRVPDMVAAIIYEDPYYLHGAFDDITLMLIFRYDAYQIYLQFRDRIIAYLSSCKTPLCNQIPSMARGKIQRDLEQRGILPSGMKQDGRRNMPISAS